MIPTLLFWSWNCFSGFSTADNFTNSRIRIKMLTKVDKNSVWKSINLRIINSESPEFVFSFVFYNKQELKFVFRLVVGVEIANILQKCGVQFAKFCVLCTQIYCFSTRTRNAVAGLGRRLKKSDSLNMSRWHRWYSFSTSILF